MNPSQLLQRSSDLVLSIGAYKVGGRSISEATRLNGVSLWDVVAPGLAIYFVPEILKGVKGAATGSVIKSFLRAKRNRYRELSAARIKERRGEYGEGSVLFLAFEPRQAASFLCVANLLKSRGRRVRVLTSRLLAGEKSIPGFDSVDYIEEYLDKEAFGLIGAHRLELSRLIKSLVKRIDPQKISTDVSTARRLLAWLGQKSSIETYLYEAVKDVELASRYIDTGSIDVVIGADDCDTRCRALFLCAAENGVPTLHIQYGLVSAEAVNWRFVGTEYSALFGESSLECLVKMGLNPEKFSVTGQPRFDALVSGRGSDTSSAKTDKKIEILFASQPNVAGCFGSEAARVKMLEGVYRAAKQIEGAVVTLRPHPDEDLQVHRKIIGKTGVTVTTATSGSVAIEEAIKACDVLLTFHSTTALEALIADKPVILYGDGSNPIAATYIESGAVLAAKTPEELVSMVGAVVACGKELARLSKQRRIFVDRHTRNRDGKAGERVAGLVERIAGSGKGKSRGLVS